MCMFAHGGFIPSSNGLFSTTVHRMHVHLHNERFSPLKNDLEWNVHLCICMRNIQNGLDMHETKRFGTFRA